MNEFCEDVLAFLISEYNDSYQFNLERRIACPHGLVHNNEKVELTITLNPGYKLTIVNDSMLYIFCLYMDGEFIEERGQYRWQKELIDMIEGS